MSHVPRSCSHINDFHATLLHLCGLDHRRLTYRYQGRDFRLTDVAGEVVRPWRRQEMAKATRAAT